jgi:hypothetical protein
VAQLASPFSQMRLLPMLEGVVDLTLDQLNEVSQPWVELEYNRKVHSAIGQTPLQRFLNDKNVAQPCPSTEKLQLAFTTEVRRMMAPSVWKAFALKSLPSSAISENSGCVTLPGT